MRRVLLTAGFALLAGCAASDAPAPAADLIVTFDRSLSTADAFEVVRQAAPEAEAAGRFAPTVVSVSLDGPPSTETTSALFDAGAIEVTARRTAAELADLAFPSRLGDGTPLEAQFDSLARAYEREAALPAAVGRYALRVTFPSSLPTRTAEARFEAAVGLAPSGVTAHPAELHVVPPAGGADALAARLRALPQVLDVRTAG